MSEMRIDIRIGFNFIKCLYHWSRNRHVIVFSDWEGNFYQVNKNSNTLTSNNMLDKNRFNFSDLTLITALSKNLDCSILREYFLIQKLNPQVEQEIDAAVIAAQKANQGKFYVYGMYGRNREKIGEANSEFEAEGIKKKMVECGFLGGMEVQRVR